MQFVRWGYWFCYSEDCVRCNPMWVILVETEEHITWSQHERLDKRKLSIVCLLPSFHPSSFDPPFSLNFGWKIIVLGTVHIYAWFTILLKQLLLLLKLGHKGLLFVCLKAKFIHSHVTKSVYGDLWMMNYFLLQIKKF